jgi:hypothetical protein
MPLEEFARDASWLCAGLQLNLAQHPRSARTAPYQLHACGPEVDTPTLQCSGTDASIPGPSRRARRSKPISHGARATLAAAWRERRSPKPNLSPRTGSAHKDNTTCAAVQEPRRIRSFALSPPRGHPKSLRRRFHDYCIATIPPLTFVGLKRTSKER